MKALASILTAAVVLIGAEVLVKSSKAPAPTDATQFAAGTLALHGGTGMPPLPPDAF